MNMQSDRGSFQLLSNQASEEQSSKEGVSTFEEEFTFFYINKLCFLSEDIPQVFDPPVEMCLNSLEFCH